MSGISGLFKNTAGANMRVTPLKSGEKYAFDSLKGKALIAAEEAGMIPAAKSGDGYNVAPFLKFWELFTPALNDAFQNFQQQGQMFRQ